jgi:hypothetical protein
MRLHHSATAVLLVSLSFLLNSTAWGQEQTTKKFYTGKQLTEARNRLRDYRFIDPDVRGLFSLDDKEVAAVLLEVSHRGNEVEAIRISANYHKDKNLRFVKRLTREDKDFSKLVDGLDLKNRK